MFPGTGGEGPAFLKGFVGPLGLPTGGGGGNNFTAPHGRVVTLPRKKIRGHPGGLGDLTIDQLQAARVTRNREKEGINKKVNELKRRPGSKGVFSSHHGTGNMIVKKTSGRGAKAISWDNETGFRAFLGMGVWRRTLLESGTTSLKNPRKRRKVSGQIVRYSAKSCPH